MARAKRRRKKICAYCGELKPSTQDHVIQRCLFLKPLPAFMATVPACDECNSRKALHDDFLCDVLTSDASGIEHPVAKEIFESKVLSSHRQNKSLVARIMLNEGRAVPATTKSGIVFDEYYVAKFDFDRAIEMFSFIVRGLYYRLRRITLPTSCQFDVRRLGADDFTQVHDQFYSNGCNGPYTLGNDVFWCVYQYAASNDAITLWLLVFYGRIAYSVITTPADYKWPNQSASS